MQFFIIFKGFSIARFCLRPEEVPLKNLIEIKGTKLDFNKKRKGNDTIIFE